MILFLQLSCLLVSGMTSVATARMPNNPRPSLQTKAQPICGLTTPSMQLGFRQSTFVIEISILVIRD